MGSGAIRRKLRLNKINSFNKKKVFYWIKYIWLIISWFKWTNNNNRIANNSVRPG
jgi:hypothetical protein